MLWLTGIVCLAIGVAAGLLISRQGQFGGPNKVSELEAQIEELRRSHSEYREQVSEHFNTSAELVQQMTESYRDVYQHLASGAQTLCSEDIASRLLPPSDPDLFPQKEDGEQLEPPKDYAPRPDPSQGGALSEEFGLEKATQ